MRGFTKIVVRGFTALLVLILLLAALAAGAIYLTLPSSRDQAPIPGLSAPVDITYDADDIPRIKAANALDAAAALGYVHARDRMFQMELMRRAASGRLSEIAGEPTLAMDRMMRVLGLRRAAVADFEGLPKDTQAMLRAYANGVNAWIDRKGRFAAPEFLVLGAPEPWSPVDSLLWAKTMGLWLSMNWRQELARLGLAGKAPAGLLDTLWPPRGDVNAMDAFADPSLLRDLPLLARTARRLAAVLPGFPRPFTRRFLGPMTASNEWAVDGRHSATGAPLLAGDPHLDFGFPGIWYLARIETPDGVLAGATAPGVPFLVLGHNSHIAWTFTTTGADVQDIFVEKPAGQGRYMTPDGPRPFEVHEEAIGVRGQGEQLLIVRETRHGPVISDLDNPAGPILAVEMANLQPGDTAAAGLLALNRATTVQEAGKAAEMITSPVQNLLVADGKTIGEFTTGRVPIRKAGDGSAPVPGDGSHDWIGWATGDQLPHSVAPASGRLVNGNEPTWPADFPVAMAHDTFGAWRADRIRTLLNGSERHTTADFASMQLDVQDRFAQAVLPRLLKIDPPAGLPSLALDQLKSWDGAAVVDKPAPLIFTAWMETFYQLVLRRNGLPHGLGAPTADFVNFVLSPAGAQWCGGDCTPMLRDSLSHAADALAQRFGHTPAQWRWGDAHEAVFAHPLLRFVPILGPASTISIAAPGDSDTVDQGGVNAELQDVHGPAFRGVYDLSDLDKSLFVMAPGQSGNPFSAHARDFVTRWRDGATITLGPTPDRVTMTLRLTP
ncbi:MAG TPA: penicillin acylase family protein [Rhodopila sp.]|uniref:penicillin acylase family protein n=1 Tax=Rhodopila sp. TaxID=2480087 RepID=UPI002BCDD1A2|nr:penicillin acylase family protein [Rhodopila sp.]HVY15757.1 penicillin acylase family protein [Rhodopila sp.]